MCHLLAPPSLCHSNNVCKSRLWHSHFNPQQSALCFVFDAQTFLNPVGAGSSPCALRRQYSERKVVVCVHTSFLHCAPRTLLGFAVIEDIHLSQVCEPNLYTYKMYESNRFTNEKRPSHADFFRRKCLKKNNEQFTSSASFSTFGSVFLTMEITSPTTVQVKSSCRRADPCRRRIEWTKRIRKNLFLRMESQKVSIRNIIFEEKARSQLEALFYQDQQFKIAVRGHQRQARDAVNQAVRESSEKYEVMMIMMMMMMMQEFQGIQNRYEGRLGEHERRVAQVVVSEARDALRGQPTNPYVP